MTNRLHIFGSRGLVGNALVKKMPGFLRLNEINRFTTFGSSEFNLETFNTLPQNTFREGDFAVILSAVSSPDLCEQRFDEVKAINVVGTRRLIRALLDEGVRVFFASSDAVYGEVIGNADEEMACNPIGNYGKMKYEIEQAFAHEKNFKSLRFSLIISPDDKFTKYLRHCAGSKETASVYSNLHRSAIALNDVCEGVLHCVMDWHSIRSGTINFGGPDLLTRNDIALMFKDKIDNSLSATSVEAPDEFFIPRARSINLNSSLLETIMGRKTTDIEKYMATWDRCTDI